MKQKLSLLGSVVLVVLFFIGIYQLYQYSRPKAGGEAVKEEASKDTTPKLVDESLIEEETYKTPTAYTTFNVTYPQFKNVSKDFNQKIQDVVLEGVYAHKKDSEANWQARYDTRIAGDKITEFPSARSRRTPR